MHSTLQQMLYLTQSNHQTPSKDSIKLPVVCRGLTSNSTYALSFYNLLYPILGSNPGLCKEELYQLSYTHLQPSVVHSEYRLSYVHLQPSVVHSVYKLICASPAPETHLIYKSRDRNLETEDLPV